MSFFGATTGSGGKNGAIIGTNGEAETNNGLSDDLSAELVGLLTNSRMYGFDGIAWDKLRIDGNGNLKVVNPSPTPLNMTHTKVAAGITSKQIIPSNPNRKYLLIVNDSDSDIYINIGGNAVKNEGIRINANGGSFSMSVAESNISTVAINGISIGDGKNVLITEGV